MAEAEAAFQRDLDNFDEVSFIEHLKDDYRPPKQERNFNMQLRCVAAALCSRGVQLPKCAKIDVATGRRERQRFDAANLKEYMRCFFPVPIIENHPAQQTEFRTIQMTYGFLYDSTVVVEILPDKNIIRVRQLTAIPKYITSIVKDLMNKFHRSSEKRKLLKESKKSNTKCGKQIYKNLSPCHRSP